MYTMKSGHFVIWIFIILFCNELKIVISQLSDLRCLPNPCYNGGTCVNRNGEYICICFENWTGPRCEKGLVSSGTQQTNNDLQRSFSSNTDPTTGGFIDPLMDVIDGLIGPSPDMIPGTFGSVSQDALNTPSGNTANLDQNSLNAFRNDLARQQDISGGKQPVVFGDNVNTGSKKEAVPSNEGLSATKSSPALTPIASRTNEKPFNPPEPTQPKRGKTLGIDEPIVDPLSAFGEPTFGSAPIFDTLPTGSEPLTANGGLGTASKKETVSDINTKTSFGDIANTPLKTKSMGPSSTDIMSGSPILDSSLSKLNSVTSKSKLPFFNTFPKDIPDTKNQAQPMTHEEHINPVVLKEFIPFNTFASTLTRIKTNSKGTGAVKQPFRINPVKTIIDTNPIGSFPSPKPQDMKHKTGKDFNQCAWNTTRRDSRGDVNFFETRLADNTWQRMACASGSQWEDHTCHCSKIAKTPTQHREKKQGCTPMLWMDFTYGIQDISGVSPFRGYIDETLKIYNDALCFDGQQYLHHPRFNSYLDDALYISIRFKINVTDRVDAYPIITNCESGHQEPSYGMVLKGRDNEVVIFLSTTEAMHITSYPINVSTWNTATLRYDGKYFSSMVNGQRNAPQPATGTIRRPHAPLVFGYCGRYGYFKGCIDDVMVYDCIPSMA